MMGNKEVKKWLDLVDKALENDAVNHPPHYCKNGIETIDYLKAFLTPEEYKGYLKGTLIAYVSRAPYKENESQDYKKAAWYAEKLKEINTSDKLYYSKEEIADEINILLSCGDEEDPSEYDEGFDAGLKILADNLQVNLDE